MGCGNSNSVEVKENNEQKLKSEINFQENEYNKQNQNYVKEIPLANVENPQQYTLVIHSKEWEKRHVEDQNNYFHVIKFINYLKDKPKSKKNKKK